MLRKKTVDTSNTFVQPENMPAKDDTAELYAMAIAEYIKAEFTKNKSLSDTIFINKRPDFQQITLPAVIEHTGIMLLSYEEAKQKLSYRRSMVVLNIMDWIDKEAVEFLIVRFNEFKPQHNCSIFFKRNAGAPVLDSLSFAYPYGKTQRHEGDFHP